MVPAGDGMGLAKSGSVESGMLTFNGAIDVPLSESRLPGVECEEVDSSTNDWKTNLMFVLGKRNTHLFNNQFSVIHSQCMAQI